VYLPTYFVGEALQSGRLVTVLDDYTAPPLTLRALYPHNRHLSDKVHERSYRDSWPFVRRCATMSKNWIAVASAEHVRLGRSQGFIQVWHGKAAPLRRIQPGDRVVFYSPTEAFRGKDRLRAFTAIGIVKQGEPYRAEMSGGFSPFRRDVAWQTAKETLIEPLLEQLEFTSDKRNWGYQLRFGLFEISDADMARIARAMGASLV
jgi:hypothetical protein